ncbi:hypothetical protein T265_13043, partial [Opisthorchis viverrini]
MLVSYPELRRDPGPMTTSTPNKELTTNERMIHRTIPNGNGYPGAQVNGQTENSHSCPTSPVDSSAHLLSTPIREPEVSSSSSFATDGREGTMAPTMNSNQSLTKPVVTQTDSLQTTKSGHRNLRRKMPQETSSLKQRLILALANMIPHRESLTLRLLINYTIDDQNSECLVIDETLCRGSPSLEKQARLEDTTHSDSGCAADDEEQEPKRRQLSRPSRETHVLDLSVHSDRDELELEEAMNTEPEDPAEEDHTDSRDSSPSALGTESLTLRLLINYTIDDQNSECLVIDETLCRGSPSLEKQARLEDTTHSDSGCAADDEEQEPKRRQLSRPSRETHVLDLSVHSDRDELELEEAMNTEPEDPAEEDHTDSRDSSPSALGTLLPGSASTTTTEAIDTHALIKNFPSGPTASLNPLLIPNLTSGQSNMPAIFTTSSLPLVDSSVLALLPLLQQQQQQQQHQQQQQQHQQLQNRLLGQTRLFPQSEPNMSSTPVASLPAETAETILFKEFQALLQGNSNNLLSSATTVATPTYTTALNGIVNNKVTVMKSTEPVPCVSNTTSVNLLNTSLHNPVSSTPSLVSFPLFNAFTPDQLTAVQALLPPGPFVNNSASAAPNLASLNLGSATLFNWKDRQVGLETLGVVPASTNRQLTQPVANLLNHISVPQATPISLRALSTLSQLFNANVDQSALKNKNTSNDNESKLTANSPTTGASERKPGTQLLDPSFTGTTARPPNVTIVTPSRDIGITQPQTDSLVPVSEQDLGDSSPLSVNNSAGTNGGYSSNQFMFGRRLAHTRRFICNQCRKNFASLAELNRHTLEAHTSFKCTICSAHFTQRSNLQRHSLKHVGFKPFTCNLCNKEYYRKDHLVRHIEVTHPNHDPKMNITVHLTSSECLDYLDRIHAGRASPSSENPDESYEHAPEATDIPEGEELKSEGPMVESCEDNLDDAVTQ